MLFSLVKKDMPEYTSIFVEFKPDGEVVTTGHEPGGTMTVTEERYRRDAGDFETHQKDGDSTAVMNGWAKRFRKRLDEAHGY